MSIYSGAIVLDANILIRSVLGSKVRELILLNYERCEFYTPDICFLDAEKYLPQLFKKRNIPAHNVIDVLDKMKSCVEIIHEDIYKPYENTVKVRMENKDIDD